MYYPQKSGKKTADEATTEFIEEVSRKVNLFGYPQDRAFVEHVFSVCPVPPIVVVSLEAKCSGEVLEAVIIMCKILSYEMPPKKGAMQGLLLISWVHGRPLTRRYS